ncbi:hypothetical protein NN561_003329 [Cricetulus griseus]
MPRQTRWSGPRRAGVAGGLGSGGGVSGWAASVRAAEPQGHRAFPRSLWAALFPAPGEEVAPGSARPGVGGQGHPRGVQRGTGAGGVMGMRGGT